MIVSSKDFGYTPHINQLPFHKSKARFRSLITGVRFGKTVAGAWDCLFAAIRKPNQFCWLVAPTNKYVDVGQLELQKLFDAGPNIVKRFNTRDRRWILTNGSRIECRSAEREDSLRGPGIDYIWIDEASYMKASAMRICRTRVSDKMGRISITTTPKGKIWTNDWYLYGLSDDPKYSAYESWRYESRQNPYFPEEEWEFAKEDLPWDFFRQEYMSDFLDDVAGVFRGVHEIVQEDPPASAIKPCSMGIDWAKYQDWTVFTVMDKEGDVVDWHRMQKLPWPEMRKLAVEVANTWDAVIHHDSTGPGDPIHDELVAELGEGRVVGIKFSLESKRKMVQALASAIERKVISIPKRQQLIEELKWFEFEVTPSGNVTYSAPAGYHDDCVFSLALANMGRISGENYVEPCIIEIKREDAGVDSMGGMNRSGMVDSNTGFLFGNPEREETLRQHHRTRRFF